MVLDLIGVKIFGALKPAARSEIFEVNTFQYARPVGVLRHINLPLRDY
jgi:hypothetical protein